MAVVIETTVGDITVDLYLDQRPVTCLNFLKLCKMKYYNFNLFHSIRSGFIAQTGDPTGEGSGGQSIFGLLEGPEKRFFTGEKMPKIRHADTGLLSMVCTGDMMVGSQFFFTLAPDLDSLDGVHCVIGEVTEGHDVLRKLNDAICDETHRPYQDVRITHTVVLEDPFNDPPGLRAPSRSPSPSAERLKGGRIAPDEEIDETQGKTAAEIQEMIEEKEAKARATILEIVGDLPDADIAPPENVLFVCKLNPVTTDEDLEIIFSRFGTIVSCEVIRDKKTGDSLQYAFIEFSDKKSCEDAYFKMDNVLIDDRRIHVDFSQSVSKMKWLGKGRGVKYFNDNESKDMQNDMSKQSRNRDRDGQKYKEHHRNRENHSNSKRYDHKDQVKEKHHECRQDRHENDSKEKSHREKSLNASLERSRDKKSHKNRSRSRSRLEKSRHESQNDKHTSRKYKHSEDEKHSKNSENNIHNDKYPNNSYRHKNSRSYRSRSPNKNEKSELKVSRNKENSDKCEKKDERNYHRSDKNSNSVKTKRKHEEDERSSYKGSKRSKAGENIIESHTPSPVLEKKNKKKYNTKKERVKRVVKKTRNAKKKRKPSTSSSESDSSSSTDSSSSSSEDTTSSSDSSSSSSSSTSDSSTSSSSSSESESNKKKRRKKNVNSKIEKKAKKKL